MFIVRIYTDILIFKAFMNDPYEVMKNDIEEIKLLFGVHPLINWNNNEKSYKNQINSLFKNKYFINMADKNLRELFIKLLDAYLLIKKWLEECGKK